MLLLLVLLYNAICYVVHFRKFSYFILCLHENWFIGFAVNYVKSFCKFYLRLGQPETKVIHFRLQEAAHLPTSQRSLWITDILLWLLSLYIDL